MDEIRIDTRSAPVSVEAAGEPGFDVSLAIRPEHMRLEPQGASVSLGEAKVIAVVFQGSFKRVLAVSIKNRRVTFIAKVRANHEVAVGDTVTPCCHTEDPDHAERNGRC